MEQSFSISESLNVALNNMTWIEIWAVITGLIYVILAVKEIIWCWAFGILSSILSIYLFYTGKLYAESILYFYYVLAGIYGWYTWSRSHSTKTEVLDEPKPVEEIEIHTWSFGQHIRAIFTGVLLALLLAFVLKHFTDAKIPMLDAFTTIFSFIATYMVTRKVLENWLYWIVIDVVTIGMYFSREYYLYALLMVAYTFIAVIGYFQWKAIHKKSLDLPIR